jgi:hypothetical protein
MLNTPLTRSFVRPPRGAVKVNGLLTPGWIDWEVDNNGFYQADTFRVSFAISELPDAANAQFWATASDISIEVFAGIPNDPDNYSPSDLKSLILGNTDDITYNPVNGTIEVAGRDYTSKFIDTKTSEKWPNLTSSQIVAKIAARHDMNAVITPTKTKAGKYYDIDHIRLTDQRTEWDLMSYLAHQESYALYVRGNTLHFEPKASPSSDPYVIQWKAGTPDDPVATLNGLSLILSRNLTLAKDIVVIVKSWNVKNKKGFTKTAKAKHTKNKVLYGASQPAGEPQTYSFVVPGLTPQQALDYAQAKLREITAHEVKLNATLPGDSLLDVNVVIQLTGTAFAQIFYPDSIIRSMSFEGGYLMEVHAKNHSPDSEVLA